MEKRNKSTECVQGYNANYEEYKKREKTKKNNQLALIEHLKLSENYHKEAQKLDLRGIFYFVIFALLAFFLLT